MNDAQPAMPVFDRTLEDIGNIVELGHVNVRVPDQRLATLFYLTGLGFTRDPYQRVGIENMWVNVGRAQFHLPTGKPQVLRGVTGLVLPDLASLLRRLEGVRHDLTGTNFAFERIGDAVEVTCPWGNRLRCHAPDPARFGAMVRGMPYVEVYAAPDSAGGIVRFYEQILGTGAVRGEDSAGLYVRVPCGVTGEIIYRESHAALPPYDGHHLQITLADFSSPHRRLLERDLITEESDQHQYRFERVIDPDNGDVMAVIEHETRSMRHPMFGRELVNRDPV
jgi:hypothetical protein